MLSPPCDDDDKPGASRALYRAYTYTTCPERRREPKERRTTRELAEDEHDQESTCRANCARTAARCSGHGA